MIRPEKLGDTTGVTSHLRSKCRHGRVGSTVAGKASDQFSQSNQAVLQVISRLYVVRVAFIALSLIALPNFVANDIFPVDYSVLEITE